jgi:hypothetical protein
MCLKTNSLRPAASNGPIVPAPVMEVMMTCARCFGGMMQEKTEVLENRVPECHLAHHRLHMYFHGI